MPTSALLSPSLGQPLRLISIERRALRPDDVDVRVTYCGVCHSDVHALGARPAGVDAPLVPGHEFVGEVVAVGDAVTDFAPGDPVAVGNIVDSCGTCRMCQAGQENFCAEFPTLTYGGHDRVDGNLTQGAYAQRYVVRDRFVYHLPAALDPAATAPLLCAGVTVWEPLRSANVTQGTRLGVVGLGGLGHLAVRLGAALGAEVTVFTTSAGKIADARRLGASRVVVSTDAATMKQTAGSLDVIIDTASGSHEFAPYLRALDLDGTLFVVGHLGSIEVAAIDLLIGRKHIASAGSGGRHYTRDLLDFCAAHGITADVEVIAASNVNNALDRLARNDVRYRFVLDMAQLHDD